MYPQARPSRSAGGRSSLAGVTTSGAVCSPRVCRACRVCQPSGRSGGTTKVLSATMRSPTRRGSTQRSSSSRSRRSPSSSSTQTVTVVPWSTCTATVVVPPERVTTTGGSTRRHGRSWTSTSACSTASSEDTSTPSPESTEVTVRADTVVCSPCQSQNSVAMLYAWASSTSRADGGALPSGVSTRKAATPSDEASVVGGCSVTFTPSLILKCRQRHHRWRGW